MKATQEEDVDSIFNFVRQIPPLATESKMSVECLPRCLFNAHNTNFHSVTKAQSMNVPKATFKSFYSLRLCLQIKISPRNLGEKNGERAYNSLVNKWLIFSKP